MRNRRTPLAMFLAASSLVALAAASAPAQQILSRWVGPANGFWSAPGNWHNLDVPNIPGDVALIPNGTSPVLNISVTLDKFGIEPGAILQHSNNVTMTVLAQTDGLGVTGLMSNEGIYAMNSAGNITDLRISGPAGSYAAFGNIFLTPSRLVCSNSTANRIYGVNGVEKLILGEEAILEGSAQLGLNLLEVENYGAIRATASQGLYLDPNGAGFTNRGTLAAVSGPLFVTNGVFRNLGAGAIVAEAGQSVYIDSARVEGGQLDTSISGSIYTRGSSLVDVRLNGFARVPNNTNCRLETALTLINSGSTFSLESAGNVTDAIIDTPVTLHGASFNAGITSSNSTANRIYSNSGQRLTLADTAYIRGSMQLGFNLMPLTVNEFCAVEAFGNQGLIIDPDAGGVLNNGVLRGRAGSTLTLANGVFTNSLGTIDAEGGGTVSISSATILGGRLTGGGVTVLASSLLDNVTNEANLQISNNTSDTLRNTLVNNSTLSMNSAGNVTDLKITGPVTISGPGAIVASNTQANRFYSDNESRLTNAAGHTIRGSMQLGLNLMSVTNNGLIEAAGSQGMTIDADGNGFDNNNLVRANSGSSLVISSTAFDNTGAIIHAQDNATVNINSSTVLAGTLTSAGTGFINFHSSELNSVTNSADLRLPNNNSDVLRNTLINNATLSMNSAGNVTDLRIVGPVTITGPGSISASNTQANRMYSDNGSTLTNAAGHTIRGSMQLGVNLMSIINNGLIEAVGNQGMTIDADVNGFDNNNLVRASSGSSLNISSSAFDNTGATIHAQDNSSVTFSSSTILAGTLTSAGSGFINFVSSELNAVTNNADLRLPNNSGDFLRNTLVNNGALNMNSAGNTTDLRMVGPVTISGTGALNASNSQANRIYGDAGSRLTNGASHTIRGAMQLGVNLMSITNQGSIIATGSQGITIDPDANGFDNQGVLNASGGNITIDAGPFTTSGTVIADAGRLINRTSGNFIQTGGNVVANGEIQVVSNDYQLQGGFLSGTGLIDSNVINSAGTMAPGSPTGVLTIEGNFTQNSGATFDFEVGSTTNPALNDTLNLISGGVANLSGTIRIHRTPGFVPPLGQGFTIVGTAPNLRLGNFTSIISDDFWHIEYLHNAAVAVFDGLGTPACPADFNDDGVLDLFDYLDFVEAFAANLPSADYNNDFVIDFFDYLDFIDAFSLGC